MLIQSGTVFKVRLYTALIVTYEFYLNYICVHFKNRILYMFHLNIIKRLAMFSAYFSIIL